MDSAGLDPKWKQSWSRKHAIFEVIERQWTLTDCSTNGVLVNGTKLAKGAPHALRHDDELCFGTHNSAKAGQWFDTAAIHTPFKFRIVNAAPALASPPHEQTTAPAGAASASTAAQDAGPTWLLDTVSARHTDWLFGGLFELVHNANDARASALDITVPAWDPAKEAAIARGAAEDELTFYPTVLALRDNGSGMAFSDVVSMFKVGRRTENAAGGRIGGFGLGFKTGSLAVGHTVVVFSGSARLVASAVPREVFTIGVLSIKPTLDNQNQPHLRMIGSFDASKGKHADGEGAAAASANVCPFSAAGSPGFLLSSSVGIPFWCWCWCSVSPSAGSAYAVAHLRRWCWTQPTTWGRVLQTQVSRLKRSSARSKPWCLLSTRGSSSTNSRAN